MRACFALFPLLICAAPAIAQSPEPADQQFQLPPELTDPAFADRMSRVMDGISKAFLDVKIGEVEAAVEGREATAVEKRLRIRDVGGRDFERRMAEARPQIEQSVRALQRSLPELMKSMEQVQKSLERATANLPDPTYPKR